MQKEYHDFPEHVLSGFENTSDFILLESSKYDVNNYRSFLFYNPVQILSSTDHEEIPEILTAVESAVKNNKFAAGYISYEAGLLFEGIKTSKPGYEKLIHFGIFENPLIFNHIKGEFENSNNADSPINKNPIKELSYEIKKIKFRINKSDYKKKIDLIKTHIKNGDVYQVNFTDKLSFDFHGSAVSLYQDLKKKQPVPYGAFIKTASDNILSLSPELFFRINDKTITTEPMKGTVKRGRTNSEDKEIINWLKNDLKNTAENLMIVDLLRNDFGKIAESGSIKVKKLFKVEKYPTLFQMTSTVEAKLKPQFNIVDIFKNIFPCGSITGAPKISAMKLIDTLEQDTRGIYTGAIGYISPDGESVFNVAIRNLHLKKNKGIMGVGSGIVYDSIAKDEYNECILKTSFLTKPPIDFELIETILWDKSYFLLEDHLKRLLESSKYFYFKINTDYIKNYLIKISKKFTANIKYKVRLLLKQDSQLNIESTLIQTTPDNKNAEIYLSDIRTDSSNPFLFHKTTNRGIYNSVLKEAVSKGYEDAVFLNEKNQLTEGTIHNIFIFLNGKYYTPPVESGLLNGVYRQYMFKKMKNVHEKILTIDDLSKAEKIFLTNSVKGIYEVSIKKHLRPQNFSGKI